MVSFLGFYRFKLDYVELVKCWPVIGKTSGEDDILNVHDYFDLSQGTEFFQPYLIRQLECVARTQFL